MKRVIVLLIFVAFLLCISFANAESWVCPNCGKNVDSAFCPDCGTAKPGLADVLETEKDSNNSRKIQLSSTIIKIAKGKSVVLQANVDNESPIYC